MNPGMNKARFAIGWLTPGGHERRSVEFAGHEARLKGLEHQAWTHRCERPEAPCEDCIYRFQKEAGK